jgi:hypothetical protein
VAGVVVELATGDVPLVVGAAVAVVGVVVDVVLGGDVAQMREASGDV